MSIKLTQHKYKRAWIVMPRIALNDLVFKRKGHIDSDSFIRKLPKGPDSKGGRVVGVVITRWTVA